MSQQDFGNSYARRPVRLGGDVAKLLFHSRAGTSEAAAVDKENVAAESNNAGRGSGANNATPAVVVVHAKRPDARHDFFAFVAGTRLCSTSINEKALFEADHRRPAAAATAAAPDDVSLPKANVLTLKHNIAAAAFCANCTCVVLGVETGSLTFATTAGKILFSQKLFTPPAQAFESIVVLPHERDGTEDIIVLATDGTLVMFHEVDFVAIQGLFARKELAKLAAYRRSMVTSTVSAGAGGAPFRINAALVGSSSCTWVAACSAKPQRAAVQFWRTQRHPQLQQQEQEQEQSEGAGGGGGGGSSDAATTAASARVTLAAHPEATARVTEQASHAGVAKMEWTADGKWFMLLGAEGRLSWWTAEGCQLVKTLDEFSSVLDFALLETDRAGQRDAAASLAPPPGQVRLPRVAIQKRRSSGASVEVLYLDGKKIRRGFSVGALSPTTRLLKSYSMPGAFFTVAAAPATAAQEAALVLLQVECFSDPSIRMQQLQREGGLEAAMDVANKFSINPVGFLEASLAKITAQINALDGGGGGSGDSSSEGKSDRDRDRDHDSDSDTRTDATTIAALTQELCAVVDRIEDDYAAIDALYGAGVHNLRVLHQLHAKAAERFAANQASEALSPLDKRRFREMYVRLRSRWQIFERTFCGSLQGARSVLRQAEAAEGEGPRRSDVAIDTRTANDAARCTTINTLEWQHFRTSKVTDVVATLLNRGMAGQAQAVWRFFVDECDAHAAPSVLDILRRFDAASAFSVTANADACFFADVFVSWLREVVLATSKDDAPALGALRDWVFSTASKVQAQAQASVTSAKIAHALVAVLDPRQFGLGGGGGGGGGGRGGGGITCLGRFNSPARVLQRIQVAKAFQEHVSGEVLREAGFSTRTPSVCSVEQLQFALTEAIYLQQAHGLAIDRIASSSSSSSSVAAATRSRDHHQGHQNEHREHLSLIHI